MKFRDFIKLEILCEASDLVNDENYDWIHYHHGNIGGRKVTITYSKHGNGHKFGVDYDVEGETFKQSDMDPHTGSQILHFVNRKVGDFIKEKKPEKLVMVPNTNKKRLMYNSFAKKIARKYNGEAIIKPMSSEIEFNHA